MTQSRKDLLRIADLSSEGLTELLVDAMEAKRDPGRLAGAAAGKVVAVIFEKPSLRTRFSVEAALARMGAHPIGAYDREVGLGSREPLDDAARVLERYVEAMVVRTFGHDRVEALAAGASIPVVNALSDLHHPLQALADLQTVAECCCEGDVRSLKGKKVAYVGDGNNVAHSLIEAGALMGTQIAVATPPGYEPDEEIVTWARSVGGDIVVTSDPAAACRDADAVYTDVWASMGQESESSDRRRVFEPYRVDTALMSQARADAIFLHCLPAHRGEEVEGAVIDGSASRVFDQAENRMHTASAVLAWALGVG